MPTILVVDDEPSIVEVVTYALGEVGFATISAATGPSALLAARENHIDLVILDVMLPGIDGFTVCRELRATSAVPIILLTARDDELDRVVGLELGADDYVVKPFGVRELVARVRALLRRSDLTNALAAAATESIDPTATITAPSALVRFGALTLDLEGHTAQWLTTKIDLTRIQFRSSGLVCGSSEARLSPRRTFATCMGTYLYRRCAQRRLDGQTVAVAPASCRCPGRPHRWRARYRVSHHRHGPGPVLTRR